MSIETIALASGDRPEWEVLWDGYLAFYEHELSAEQTELTFQRFLDPNVKMWAAIARDADGRAVGFVHWLTHPSTWSDAGYVYLEDLFVAPDARSAGVGRALIAHVVNWARENGHPKVYWQTAYTNETARRLYDTLAKNEYIVYEIDLP
ncbi:MAG: N-acetyltransferase family protein [Agromyces sp.]